VARRATKRHNRTFTGSSARVDVQLWRKVDWLWSDQQHRVTGRVVGHQDHGDRSDGLEGLWSDQQRRVTGGVVGHQDHGNRSGELYSVGEYLRRHDARPVSVVVPVSEPSKWLSRRVAMSTAQLGRRLAVASGAVERILVDLGDDVLAHETDRFQRLLLGGRAKTENYLVGSC